MIIYLLVKSISNVKVWKYLLAVNLHKVSLQRVDKCCLVISMQTIETKMKMQELKLKGQQNLGVVQSEQPSPQKAIEVSHLNLIFIMKQKIIHVLQTMML